MTDGDMITTCISWMLGRRPSFVSVYQPPLERLEEALERARSSPNTGQAIVFMGMAGLMTLAKDVRSTGTNANNEYLAKRWQALCATIDIEDIFATRIIFQDQFMTMIRSIEVWQDWVKPRGDLRKALLDSVLQPVADDTPLIVRGTIDQVKMVLQDFGLKSIIIMDSFVSSQNRAILLPAIAQQTADLRTTLTELRALHGARFTYIKIYPLEGSERLNHRNYPDLYHASVMSAVQNKALGQEGRYVVTDVQTNTPKHIIEIYIKREFQAEVTMDETTRNNLRILGIKPAPLQRALEWEDDVDMGRRRGVRRP